MSFLALLLLAAGATRPMTAVELRAAHDAVSCELDAKQAFHTTALHPSPVWFVVGDCAGVVTGLLLEPPGKQLDSFVLGRENIDAVGFDDLDGDGEAELLLVSGPAAMVMRREGDGYVHADGIEARVARVLGNGPTVPKIRELYRREPGPKPKLPKGLSLDCSEASLPFAVSDDGRYGAWLNQQVDIHDFETGARPKWLGDRLQQVLDERLQPHCEMLKRDEPHGTSLDCVQPLSELNALVAALEPQVHFRDVDEALVKDGGERPTAITVETQSRRNIEVPLRALECNPREFPHVLGVLYGPRQARIVYEGEDSGDHPLYQCTPEEQELERECYYGGGTCIHDVLCVPTPQPPQRVRMLTVPLR